MKTPRRPKKLSLHKMIPNMITLTALAVGMTAIKFAIAERWEAAIIAITIAAFMDAFDGAAARLLKAQSRLGAELDSFSDFICFGVAPALTLFLWSLQDWPRWGWPVALIFAIAVALRLARFNIASEDIATDKDDPLRLYFSGVPSPAGAGLAVLPMILSFQSETALSLLKDWPEIVAAWSLFVAALMVSAIPTFSTKQIRIPYKMNVPFLGLFAILLAGLINVTWITLTAMAAGYLLLIPFSIAHYRRKKAAFEKDGFDRDEEDDLT